MEIRVSFVGFPGVEAIIGGKELQLPVRGGTLAAVLAALEESHGDTVVRALCHDGRTLDSGVVVFRNDVRVGAHQRICEGDRLSFVRMVAGG